MSLRQGLGTVAFAAALGLMSLIAAPSASAAVTGGAIQDLGNGTVRVTYDAGGHIVDLIICPAGTASCVFSARIYNMSTAVGSSAPLGASPALIQEGTTVRPRPDGSTPLPAGNYVFSLVGTGGGSTFYPVVANVAVTIGSGGGGGGGGGSSSAAAATPQTFELSLTPNDGTVCAKSSESGSAGAWMALPGANDCKPPATKPNAKLLGWATTPNFPVAIAKRQVANGWGAYETFNADGQLTGVFIPAGGSTLVSAAGNLYAVWSE